MLLKSSLESKEVLLSLNCQFMAPYLTLLAYYLAAALSFSFSYRYPFLYFCYLLTNFIIQFTILVIISWTVSTLRHGTNQVLEGTVAVQN